MRFTHIPTEIGGDTDENPAHDRIICFCGGKVGRVRYYNNGAKGKDHWQWNAFCRPAGRGKADTLEGALASIKAHVLGAVVDGVLPMSGSYDDIAVG